MKPCVRVKAPSRPLLSVVEFKREPDPDVVSMLHEFLKTAESGVLSGVAIAATWHDGAVSTAYVRGRNVFTMVGAVRGLMRRVEKEIQTP